MPSGSCWCKNLQYEFSGQPLKKARPPEQLPHHQPRDQLTALQIICHCLTCQKTSGSAFTADILVPKSALTVVSGTPKTFSKAHENGAVITLHFCPECGGAIYREVLSDEMKHTWIVMAGTLDAGIEELSPNTELWVKHRAKWLPALSGVTQIQELA